MRFELQQSFDAEPDAVTEAYADPDLYRTLVGLPKLGDIVVLGHDVDGSKVHLRARFAFTGDLPAAVTAVVDPARLTWVQESDHDLSTGVTTFRLVPDHYADRLQASGTFRVAAGRRGTGSTRTVDATLKVRAPLVAGRVEQAIVSGLAEYLQAEAPAVDAYLDGS